MLSSLINDYFSREGAGLALYHPPLIISPLNTFIPSQNFFIFFLIVIVGIFCANNVLYYRLNCYLWNKI